MHSSLQYEKFKIPKNNGKFRTIYKVNFEYQLLLNNELIYLEKKLKILDKSNVNYAFEKGKNCVLNALQHVGYNYTLSIDLINFFDSVTINHVRDLLNIKIIELCFIDGAPRQGLSTSPLIATISFLKCDELIIKQFKENNLDVKYTRYADDLIFSFNNIKTKNKIFEIIETCIEKHGFSINKNKTKLQSIRNGRIIITGVAIDKFGIYPTRKIRKKIRAAEHQGNIQSFNGLVEWSKCKYPRGVITTPSISVLPSP